MYGISSSFLRPLSTQYMLDTPAAVVLMIGRQAVLNQQPCDWSVSAEAGPVERGSAGGVDDVDDSRFDFQQRLDRHEMALLAGAEERRVAG